MTTAGRGSGGERVPRVIEVAGTAGFCMGVRRALDIVLRMAAEGPVHTDGPLIHNPVIVRMLEEKGIRPLDPARPPAAGVIVIRAHGVSPSRRGDLGRLGLRVCDATCPDVAKVQAIVKRHAERGYEIVIVGDRGHAEVEGLLGFSGGRGRVVSSPAEARRLPPLGKVCAVAQTTQDPALFGETAAILGERAAELVVFDTICRSTKARRREAIELSRRVDAMVVVGGRNSANTARLAAICAGADVPVFHVESEAELDAAALAAFGAIGVTAGTSTPDWMIERVVERLRGAGRR
ncbi:MAG: 4-hydroxy-3-methylbut-2-enyl diphosphate reductase [bacterium]|nr:4-hydroxy-3-methylbut-2-enyl diphosphate reductase [bacterium]